MNISIEVVGPKDCNCCMLGKITIGTFQEYFTLSLGYWKLQDYKNQWTEGLKRIKTENKSCLIASIQDPDKTPYLNWWLLYKRKSTIYVRNKIYFAEIYPSMLGNKLFTAETCYDHIPRRMTKSSLPGYELSEWSVDVWW